MGDFALDSLFNEIVQHAQDYLGTCHDSFMCYIDLRAESSWDMILDTYNRDLHKEMRDAYLQVFCPTRFSLSCCHSKEFPAVAYAINTLSLNEFSHLLDFIGQNISAYNSAIIKLCIFLQPQNWKYCLYLPKERINQVIADEYLLQRKRGIIDTFLASQIRKNQRTHNIDAANAYITITRFLVQRNE
ncbi:uncharacterized protein LOC143465712 [Clavelina lepadiformis]|uniref:uncharacterized protein LOC143465712 n=1 Tax=Clavelina lepadiformis TaxID=159417 RepID=UPI0040425AA7